MIYLGILILLFFFELVYFIIAEKFNIIDRPNERGSSKDIVLLGGGIIFPIALWLWSIIYGFQYPWLLAGITLAAGISFIDDMKSLPISLRLVTQFIATFMIFHEIGILMLENGNVGVDKGIVVAGAIFVAVVFFVGATNIYNFMDGINGITGGYSLAVLVPLIIKNEELRMKNGEGFVEPSLLIVIGLSVLVFCFFNYRKKAKCLAGDVGSIGIALILLFCIGKLILTTEDITWLLFLIVYGVDGCLTIVHRIMLHENLGQAHRKHAYQLMANELKMPHVVVSTIYATLQLAISLIMVYAIPNNIAAHAFYLIGVLILLALAYYLFKRKYYHLHEEYLASLKS